MGNIFIGNDGVSIFVGSQEVQKIYQGPVEVYNPDPSGQSLSTPTETRTSLFDD